MRHFKKTDGAIALVVGLAFVAVALAYTQLQHAPSRVPSIRDWLVLVAMFVLVIALDFVRITVPRLKFRTIFTVSGTVYVAATIGYNAIIGVVLTFIGLLLTEAIARRELRKLIFNVAQHVCMTGFAGVVYFAIAGPNNGVPLATARTVIAAVIASFVYLLLNNLLFSFVVGIDIGNSPFVVFMASIPGQLMQNITLPCIGLLLTTVRDLSPLSLLIALLPLLGPYIAMRGYRDNVMQMELTIEALADAVDRRDPSTAQHSERVAVYTQRVIETLGNIKFAEAEAIVSAARVHDVGKVGIPDSILNKPGPLTPAEVALIRTHPVEGCNILRKLPMYHDGLSVVQHHHERYDGAGYPDRLAGDGIPLGARIVAVADAYDVMTTNRPYARARSQREACAELLRCKGTHFDPAIVDAFITMVKQEPVPEDASLIPASLSIG